MAPHRQPLTVSEMIQLADLLLVAQMKLLEVAESYRVTYTHAAVVDTLIAYAGQAADLRERLKGG